MLYARDRNLLAVARSRRDRFGMSGTSTGSFSKRPALANPAPLIEAIAGHPILNDRIRINGVLAVADCVNSGPNSRRLCGVREPSHGC